MTELLVPVRKRETPTLEALPPTVRSFGLPGLTLDIQLMEATPDPVSLQPCYLPEGLVVTAIEPRLYGAVDLQGRIVLFWSWNPGLDHIILPWTPDAGELTEPEAHPDGERMCYYMPGQSGRPATVFVIDGDTSILLTSQIFERDELLRIAASFPHAEGEGSS